MNTFKKSLIRKAKKVIASENLPTPKKIKVYNRASGKYPYVKRAVGAVLSNRDDNGRATSIRELYVTQYSHRNKKKLTHKQQSKIMAHELAHLKYTGHPKKFKQLEKKIYRGYFME